MNRQQIISLISLFICFLGVVGMIFFNRQLAKARNALATSNITIEQRDSLIEVQDSLQLALKEENQSLLDVLDKLSAPASAAPDNTGQTKEAYVRSEKEKIRGNLIRQLYTPGSGGEKARVNAQNLLLKNFSRDERLVSDLLDQTNKYLGNPKYNSSIWQTIYILSKLDGKYLQSEKERFKNLFAKAKKKGLVKPGGLTSTQINRISEKIQL